ncbi:DUF4142 domain-containing protein [Pedobacter sp. MC2016-14]|uniref:DUF4142 domain-containing protein n=1 Tax=Pedobacter sp. MC2016-14 TaxID=2897327 RepID=UPI001E59D1DA|nr:DUF4142 domain-containing protein [Pedobacter sp. MC2016-14]MCD0488468.1 DUF4142 domain-containing protein [Pedobacter sp. MC2016-14]
MKNQIIALLIGGACALQACHNSDKKDNSSTLAGDSVLDTTSNTAQSMGGETTQEDTDFIKKAAIGGMMEVEAGNLALQKTKSPVVKDFAQMMVTDHTKANLELKEVAKSKGLELPSTFPAEEQKHMDMMKTLAGDAFDRHYVQMMVTDHNKTVDLFNAGQKSENQDVKIFASKTLPVIQAHYQAAVKLDSIMQKKKMNNGDDILNISTGKEKKNQ